MAKSIATVHRWRLMLQNIPRGRDILKPHGMTIQQSASMAQNCDDHRCGKENNLWKGKLEMADYDYLQPKRRQYDAAKSTELTEKPEVPRNLDIYKERDCKIIKECKKRPGGGGKAGKCGPGNS